MNNILSRAGDLISTMQSMLCEEHKMLGYDTVSLNEISEFIRGHQQAALFSSIDDLNIDGENKTVWLESLQVSPSIAKSLEADCLAFIAANKEDLNAYVNNLGLEDDMEAWFNAGWDFWMTRMNHGTGYWDRDVGEPGDKLSHSCMEWPHNGLSLKIGENGEPEVFFIRTEHS